MHYLEKYKQLAQLFSTQQEMADALCCSQPLVNKLLNGKAHMSAHIAMRAEKITDGKFKATELCPRLADLDKPKKETTHENP